MSKLNVDQKTIKDLLSDNKAEFLIPDYQRPYAWDAEKECQTLWDDIFAFAIPDNDYTKFNSKTDEYYLGPIVTFKNSNGQQEVIDGQQRLTTLLLLLRAFYSFFGNMQDGNAIATRDLIAKCIWKTDEFGHPDIHALKIDSDVATDNDKEEFLEILRTGIDKKEMKSRYAQNFHFFNKQIEEFLRAYPSYFAYLPTRILNNCILLPIEAESQDTALRIFSTLNNRGKALSDADIFKAEFYKYYSKIGQKEQFINRWKHLEELCEKNFHPTYGTPMDELFTRYMYFERAKTGKKNSTTEALRTFYSMDNYAIFRKQETLSNLELVAEFWNDIQTQDNSIFSQEVLRQLYILSYAPNGMWTYFVTVYFMYNRDTETNLLSNDKFYVFLCKITAFIWAYAITNPGVNALRTPIYTEMVNLVNGKEVNFSEFKFPRTQTRNQLENYNFYNGRPITRSMLVWWAMHQKGQKMPSLDTIFEIEHIYPRNKDEKLHSLKNPKSIDLIGNKTILEKRINIRATDYLFKDKISYYKGFVTKKGEKKEETIVQELLTIADTYNDFTETDIIQRKKKILDSFCEYLQQNDLITEDVIGVE